MTGDLRASTEDGHLPQAVTSAHSAAPNPRPNVQKRGHGTKAVSSRIGDTKPLHLSTSRHSATHLATALNLLWGARGPEFKSRRPDEEKALLRGAFSRRGLSRRPHLTACHLEDAYRRLERRGGCAACRTGRGDVAGGSRPSQPKGGDATRTHLRHGQDVGRVVSAPRTLCCSAVFRPGADHREEVGPPPAVAGFPG